MPLLIAGISIALGGWVAASGGELALYVGYTVLLGFFGNAATFTPAMNNVQGWFDRRRNTAIAIVSVGPAVSGTIWPQIYRVLLPDIGWRQTLTIYGVVAGALLLLGALYVRPAPVLRGAGGRRRREEKVDLPLPSSVIMVLLSAASFCCCAAMALPFVHMVAYCGDLGYPAARGSEAVSLVLISALIATFAMARLADRIGPLPVSLLCSVIQIGSLVGFMIARDITSIYALSLLHGIPFIAIVQGYALNLRFLYGPDHRRLAAGRGHAVRHGRHGGRRLAGRRHLRRDALLPAGLPGGAGLQSAQSHAAGRALHRPAPAGGQPALMQDSWKRPAAAAECG